MSRDVALLLLGLLLGIPFAIVADLISPAARRQWLLLVDWWARRTRITAESRLRDLMRLHLNVQRLTANDRTGILPAINRLGSTLIYASLANLFIGIGIFALLWRDFFGSHAYAKVGFLVLSIACFLLSAAVVLRLLGAIRSFSESVYDEQDLEQLSLRMKKLQEKLEDKNSS